MIPATSRKSRSRASPARSPTRTSKPRSPRRSSAASALATPPIIAVTFDRDIADMRLDASNTGALQPVATRYDARNGRFDVAFEINNDNDPAPTKLRFTGTAIETVEVAVLTRDIDRADVLKSSDIAIERRPEGRSRRRGRHARPCASACSCAGRCGRACRSASPTSSSPTSCSATRASPLIYQVPGIYLTTRGKAIESGAEGDTVNVLNLQSKRTLTGVVTGRGQVTIQGQPVRADGACGRADLLAQARRSAHPRADAAALAEPVQPPLAVAKPRCPVRSSRPASRVSYMSSFSSASSSSPRRVSAAAGRRARERLLLDRPPVADRRAAEIVGDRQSDDAARLQAGADADAEAGSRLLQSELAVAQRQPRLLQGPARRPCRRPPDRDREHHRQGQHRQRDPAQPHQQGRFGHHRLHRQQDAHAAAQGPARPHPRPPTRPPRATARARSTARRPCRPTSPPS